MRALVLGMAVVLAACGGSDKATAPDAVTFAGAYSLKSVNGQPLPYVALQQGQNSITILDDHLTVSDGGSWSETENYRVVNNGVTTNQTAATAGTWLRSGNSLLFVNGQDNTTAYTGTFSSNRLDLTNGIGPQVYTK